MYPIISTKKGAADGLFRCYTNHALDQFLEHILLSKTTDRIVRIGARSKSTLLDNYNLHTISQQQKRSLRTKVEGLHEKSLYENMEGFQKEGTELCDTLTHGVSRIRFNHIADLVKQDFPNHYQQLLCEPDEDGFTIVGVKDKSYFDYWLSGKDLRTRGKSAGRSADRAHRQRALNSILQISDIWDLSLAERKTLVQHWEALLRDQWINRMSFYGERIDEIQLELDAIHSEFNARVIEKMHVVGITTTGLARYGSLLKRVQSKTLICEEAGEVLEVSGDMTT
jgi:hypothetical protein